MATDMVLKLTDIEGESKKKSFEGQIDVNDFSFGVTQSGVSATGGGGSAGRADVQDLTISKNIDKSSPILFIKSCTGEPIPEGVLTVRKTAGGQPIDYVVITMTNIIVSRVMTGGAQSDDLVREQVALNFDKISYEYKLQKADGSADAPVLTTFNVEAGVKE